MAKMKEVLVRIKQYFTKLENDKVDKVANATNNNIALFDSNGNVKDSGKSINDVGKVATVSVGGGTPIQPDQDKNIDLPAYPTRISLSINNVDNTSDSAKPVSTAQQAAIDSTGHKIDLEIDNTTFKIKAKLYDKNNTLISTSNEIDLPLESVVVGGSYDSVNKKVVLTLQNGTTIEFSVADLIYGLQSEITAQNPLSSDLVSDDNNAHKFVSANEKATWNSKQGTISDLETIRRGASAGATAVQDNDYVHTDNNYTTAEKNKLAGLSNYDDTAVRGLITAEANRATKQENKALHFKGAFDSQDGKTRQTGVLYGKDLSTLNVAEYGNITYYKIPKPKSALDYGIYSYNAINNKYPKYDGSNWNSTECIGKISGYAEAGYYWVGFTKGTTQAQALVDFQDLVLQYKLASSYTDDGIIEGESLLPLDSNMANKIRQDVVDSLNLWSFKGTRTATSSHGNTITLKDSIVTISGTNDGTGYLFGEFIFSEPIRANNTYTISIPNNHGISIIFYDTNGNNIETRYVSSFTFTPNADIIKFTIWITGNAYAWGTTTIPLMLTKSNYSYPHSEHHASKHISDDEATLLKQEWEKGLNLLPNSNNVSFGTGTDIYYNLPLEQGTYTLSFSNIVDGITAVIRHSDNTISNIGFSNISSQTFNALSGDKLERFYDSIGHNNLNIMLNEGNHPYPYQKHYGPIVHTTEAFEAVGGSKNLLPNSANITAQNQTLIFNVNIIAGKTYTFSIQGGTNTNNYSFVTRTGTTDTQIVTQGTPVNNTITFTASGNADNVAIYPNNVNNANFMLNEGSTPLPHKDFTGGLMFEKDIATLLWTNPSPNSEFASQTINVDMTNYKYIIIEYKRISDSDWQETAIKKLGVAPYPSSLPLGFCLSEIYVGTIVYRQVGFKSLTQIDFLSAYYGSEQANSWLIPVKIYGTNIP